MKNTENAASPMSAIVYCVFVPRRLSGSKALHSRSDPNRRLSVSTQTLNQKPHLLGIHGGRATAPLPELSARLDRDLASAKMRTAADVSGSNSHFGERSGRDWRRLGKGQGSDEVVP